MSKYIIITLAIIITLLGLTVVLNKNKNPKKDTQIINTPQEQISNEQTKYTTCQTDQDCVLVNADPCGCTQGGSQTAINVDYQKEFLAQFPQDVMCIQVMSNDPSCEATQTVCVNNTCELK